MYTFGFVPLRACTHTFCLQYNTFFQQVSHNFSRFSQTAYRKTYSQHAYTESLRFLSCVETLKKYNEHCNAMADNNCSCSLSLAHSDPIGFKHTTTAGHNSTYINLAWRTPHSIYTYIQRMIYRVERCAVKTRLYSHIVPRPPGTPGENRYKNKKNLDMFCALVCGVGPSSCRWWGPNHRTSIQ